MSTALAFKLMLYGFIVAEQLLIAACFIRFWHLTREKLFAFFAAGFLVMTIHRFWLGFIEADGIDLEQQTPVFMVRLLSYTLILAGVIVKNLEKRPKP